MSIEKSSLVTVRDFTPEDRNFILATFLRGLYYGDSWFQEINKDVFMANYHRIAEAMLSSSKRTIKIACLKEDPEVILGYSIAQGDEILDYIFVKSAWRSIGIAKSLLPSKLSVVTHLTKTGKMIIKTKMPSVQFNPFLL